MARTALLVNSDAHRSPLPSSAPARVEDARPGRERRRDLCPAADDRPVGVLDDPVEVDHEVGHAYQQLAERLFELGASEVRARATVHPDAEGDVAVGEPVHDELVGAVESLRGSAGGGLTAQ